MTICIHCKQLSCEHVNLKCLFLPTEFDPIRCTACKDVLHNDPSAWPAGWVKYAEGDYRHNRCVSIGISKIPKVITSIEAV
jgi:hypothetical protein